MAVPTAPCSLPNSQTPAKSFWVQTLRPRSQNRRQTGDVTPGGWRARSKRSSPEPRAAGGAAGRHPQKQGGQDPRTAHRAAGRFGLRARCYSQNPHPHTTPSPPCKEHAALRGLAAECLRGSAHGRGHWPPRPSLPVSNTVANAPKT